MFYSIALVPQLLTGVDDKGRTGGQSSCFAFKHICSLPHLHRYLDGAFFGYSNSSMHVILPVQPNKFPPRPCAALDLLWKLKVGDMWRLINVWEMLGYRGVKVSRLFSCLAQDLVWVLFCGLTMLAVLISVFRDSMYFPTGRRSRLPKASALFSGAHVSFEWLFPTIII